MNLYKTFMNNLVIIVWHNYRWSKHKNSLLTSLFTKILPQNINTSQKEKSISWITLKNKNTTHHNIHLSSNPYLFQSENHLNCTLILVVLEKICTSCRCILIMVILSPLEEMSDPSFEQTWIPFISAFFEPSFY